VADFLRSSLERCDEEEATLQERLHAAARELVDAIKSERVIARRECGSSCAGKYATALNARGHADTAHCLRYSRIFLIRRTDRSVDEFGAARD
jgi:hypothetical protein